MTASQIATMAASVSTYKTNGDFLYTKLLILHRDISNVPAIEVYIEVLKKEILPDLKKENAAIDSIEIDQLSILNGATAHIVWPKPEAMKS
ncbi:hypothetical protein [Pectobacterium carotovorum]|uniref:hypothetical protein n=1 Tax=Pectobacterium carotovorum TaxID=554 RepID=UPI00057EFA5F|nr:hypothetical protein [Pectobacterium carotovorum]KHT31218.1 hypothetical protein RD01_18575 [Pectobacterium carotovorum subsp. carotovorum]